MDLFAQTENITTDDFLTLVGNQTKHLTSNDTTNATVVHGTYPSGYSITQIIFASIIVTVLMVVIVVGNMLVIIAIATEKSLKNIQNWFIASLAVSICIYFGEHLHYDIDLNFITRWGCYDTIWLLLVTYMSSATIMWTIIYISTTVHPSPFMYMPTCLLRIFTFCVWLFVCSVRDVTGMGLIMIIIIIILSY